jgi:hypothetical protein
MTPLTGSLGRPTTPPAGGGLMNPATPTAAIGLPAFHAWKPSRRSAMRSARLATWFVTTISNYLKGEVGCKGGMPFATYCKPRTPSTVLATHLPIIFPRLHLRIPPAIALAATYFMPRRTHRLSVSAPHAFRPKTRGPCSFPIKGILIPPRAGIPLPQSGQRAGPRDERG